MSKTRVLVVDDSALIRNVLAQIIDSQPDMTVVGRAQDGLVAQELIRVHNPDVMTLDIEMPRMDGLELLELLMRTRPLPVVMVSTLTQRGSEATLRALELGAVDFLPKPKLNVLLGLLGYAEDIAFKLRAAARARVHPRTAAGSDMPRERAIAPLGDRQASTEKLIFIGASTGGTEAIREVLLHLPADGPGVLVTQHMPAGFTKSFAARLDSLCALTVKEAEDRERVLPGHVYIAPGDKHLRVRRGGAGYLTALDAGEPVNRHRPSVEVLFGSAAEEVGRNALGVMLTGMGKDGAQAMVAMRKAGAFNIAQDEKSCVVFGMPREAIAAGAVDEVVPLAEIASRVIQHLRQSTGAGLAS